VYISLRVCAYDLQFSKIFSRQSTNLKFSKVLPNKVRTARVISCSELQIDDEHQIVLCILGATASSHLSVNTTTMEQCYRMFRIAMHLLFVFSLLVMMFLVLVVPGV
jgi:hypothetical protein